MPNSTKSANKKKLIKNNSRSYLRPTKILSKRLRHWVRLLMRIFRNWPKRPKINRNLLRKRLRTFWVKSRVILKSSQKLTRIRIRHSIISSKTKTKWMLLKMQLCPTLKLHREKLIRNRTNN